MLEILFGLSRVRYCGTDRTATDQQQLHIIIIIIIIIIRIINIFRMAPDGAKLMAVQANDGIINAKAK